MKTAVELALPTLAERKSAAACLLDIWPTVSVKELVRSTEEGFIEATHLCRDGKPLFCCWFNITCDRCLHLNVAVALTTHTDIADLVEGMENLARERKCVSLRFVTERPGLLKQAYKFGYQSVGVMVMKTF